ncbi:MAG TPA: SRPBCC family protein [Flavobacterium sp.]|nr:SRPBCC family protein [Flavobacterium sp.]
MRILKYLFLLILLGFIGVSVYVATQRGDYAVVRSQYIKAPRAAVFQYLADLSNWQDWASADQKITIQPGVTTTGLGGSLSWTDGETHGAIKTVHLKENDSLAHDFEWGFPGKAAWKLKDSAGGTVVTWKVQGKLPFGPKVKATLQGGPAYVMGTFFEQGLKRLEKTLVYETNTYAIKVDGPVVKPGTIFVKQTITSTIGNLHRNVRIMATKMDFFFTKNKIVPAGKPFVLYDYFNDKTDRTRFSVCYPVRDTILTAPGSDISFGSFGEFRAVKTTLTGDYQHLREAWDKTFAHINEKGYKLSDAGQYIEVLQVGRKQAKRPSQWVTEIYIPIHYQAVAPTPVALPTAAPLPAPAESSTGEIPIP